MLLKLKHMDTTEQQKCYEVFQKSGVNDCFSEFYFMFADDLFNPATGKLETRYNNGEGVKWQIKNA